MDMLFGEPLLPAPAEQLSLLGEQVPIRIDAAVWRGWLGDPEVVERFEAKRYKRAES
jgi:hypothetical protein